MSDQKKAERMTGSKGAGQSGGGAYPRPGNPDEKSDGFQGHGGQSEMEYHGTRRLGKKEVGTNANAPAGKTKPDPR